MVGALKLVMPVCGIIASFDIHDSENSILIEEGLKFSRMLDLRSTP
jgi:hypothetical protein